MIRSNPSMKVAVSREMRAERVALGAAGDTVKAVSRDIVGGAASMRAYGRALSHYIARKGMMKNSRAVATNRPARGLFDSNRPLRERNELIRRTEENQVRGGGETAASGRAGTCDQTDQHGVAAAIEE